MERMFGVKIFRAAVCSRGEVGIVAGKLCSTLFTRRPLRRIATGAGVGSRPLPRDTERQASLFATSAFDIACAGPID